MSYTLSRHDPLQQEQAHGWLLPINQGNSLNLFHTLSSGQAFRWSCIAPDTWRGVLDGSIYTLTQESSTRIYFKVYPPKSKSLVKKKLIDYFQLEGYELDHLYHQWGTSFSNTTSTLLKDNLVLENSSRTIMDQCGIEQDINIDFAKAAAKLDGLRLLRQDPYECTISFICSQNNNIKRIKQMIERLCQRFGSMISTLDDITYFSFPTLEQLRQGKEEDFQDLGFGYRAKYIAQTAQVIEEKGGEIWVHQLRQSQNGPSSREAIQSMLCTLPGIGIKVANCIALFSLDQFDVVPVDTHVRSIASRYMVNGEGLLGKGKRSPTSKSLSLHEHEAIGDFFRKKFGDKAGWAHTILFAAELSTFQGMINDGKDIKKYIGIQSNYVLSKINPKVEPAHGEENESKSLPLDMALDEGIHVIIGQNDSITCEIGLQKRRRTSQRIAKHLHDESNHDKLSSTMTRPNKICKSKSGKIH